MSNFRYQGDTDIAYRPQWLAWKETHKAVNVGTPALGLLGRFELCFYDNICGHRPNPIHYLLRADQITARCAGAMQARTPCQEMG